MPSRTTSFRRRSRRRPPTNEVWDDEEPPRWDEKQLMSETPKPPVEPGFQHWGFVIVGAVILIGLVVWYARR